jgi:hypothetical protein
MVPEQVARTGKEANFRKTPGDGIKGSILTGIVHDEDMERAICERLREQSVQAPEGHISPIEAGDEHRDPNEGVGLRIGCEGDGTLNCQRTNPFPLRLELQLCGRRFAVIGRNWSDHYPATVKC